ncbi:thioredoxin domain-containing protein [Clostridium taeniosporum]|uniref:Thioredoxin domain-containing protein n=1 Tax=Clostridium taeniosporum TaxID=394958 RepID=A0A1D7XJU1_9CLOT|nr:thioredoxin domain-containing protein [Clostridium taeniosporum]AOR23593.1 thioredoxin domain-containing protein [Clostridium taeniosporum]
MFSKKKPNHLINEKSPYLLQHAYNPINWYSWCDEAFEKAKKEDKPIFLSIGYSTCHWCHVMEHESFEDDEVAKIMNENVIAIKVDREERPDIDSIYMTVCQALNGQGGWPLTILMTPDQKPFYAGTYFPKNSRYNMIGIMDILYSVSVQWKNNKDKIISASENILSEITPFFIVKGNDSKVSINNLDNGFKQLLNSFDEQYGGFGSAPKFPTPHKLMFLLRYYKLNNNKDALYMVEKTLDCMYRGGIFDHVGYGFSRYSTDSKWLVPHFEKMLYDNALLIITYLEAYNVTNKELYKNIAIKSLEYIARELTSKDGSFFSAQDADSEGEEGKYYTFKSKEVIEILGEDDGKYFNEYYNITPNGNFEGKNILNLIKNNYFTEENHRINNLRKKILQYRENRTKLHKDDKILTSWNGLMLAALGKAYKIIGDKKYLESAKKAIDFIFNNMIDGNGRLFARYRDSEILHKGYLDDYAFLIFGLIEIYESSFESTYLEKAIKLTKDMINLFWDEKDNGFFIYGKDGEKLIAQPKELFDGAMPSGNSVASYDLIKLSKITGDLEFEEIGEKQLNFITGSVNNQEINHSFYLISAYLALTPSKELICILKDKNELYDLIKYLKSINRFNLNILVKVEDNKKKIEEILPLIKKYSLINDNSTYYLCENNSCKSPVNNLKDLNLK